MGIHDRHRARMRKRFLKTAGFGFEDYQLLELLLYSPNAQIDTNPIAHRLIDEFGSLKGVLDADVSELMCVNGVGEMGAAIIKTAQIIAKSYNEAKIIKPVILPDIEAIGNFISPKFYDENEEAIYMMCLSKSHELLDLRKVGVGDVSSSTVDIRKLVEIALKFDTEGIVIAHNHPSGFALPSASDISTTVALMKAMDFVNITVIDHIIVTDSEWVSMLSSSLI